jgi:hypothetical protein
VAFPHIERLQTEGGGDGVDIRQQYTRAPAEREPAVQDGVIGCVVLERGDGAGFFLRSSAVERYDA